MKPFDEIWNEYYPKLTVFLRTSFHFTETEDIVQEIMLKVYTHRHSFKPARSLNTWIYTIARNHAIDVIKKQNSEKKTAEAVKARVSVSPGGTETTEDLHLRKELREDISAFIAGLPEKERQVSFLKYYEEMNYREISRVTGIPVGTIKYMIHKIKEAFAAYYGEHYES